MPATPLAIFDLRSSILDFPNAMPIRIFPTACECTEPGWCARHKCHKSRVFFEYCRRLETSFQRWENGEFPPLGRGGQGGVGSFARFARNRRRASNYLATQVGATGGRLAPQSNHAGRAATLAPNSAGSFARAAAATSSSKYLPVPYIKNVRCRRMP